MRVLLSDNLKKSVFIEQNFPSAFISTEGDLALIKVSTSTLNLIDFMSLSKWKMSPNESPGTSTCGVVVAMGSRFIKQIKKYQINVKVGSEVICVCKPSYISSRPSLNSAFKLLSSNSHLNGSLCEYITVRGDQILLKPTHLSDSQAAVFPYLGSLALSAFRDFINFDYSHTDFALDSTTTLKKENTVSLKTSKCSKILILSADSALGRICAQIASCLGFFPVLICKSLASRGFFEKSFGREKCIIATFEDVVLVCDQVLFDIIMDCAVDSDILRLTTLKGFLKQKGKIVAFNGRLSNSSSLLNILRRKKVYVVPWRVKNLRSNLDSLGLLLKNRRLKPIYGKNEFVSEFCEEGITSIWKRFNTGEADLFILSFHNLTLMSPSHLQSNQIVANNLMNSTAIESKPLDQLDILTHVSRRK